MKGLWKKLQLRKTTAGNHHSTSWKKIRDSSTTTTGGALRVSRVHRRNKSNSNDTHHDESISDTASLSSTTNRHDEECDVTTTDGVSSVPRSVVKKERKMSLRPVGMTKSWRMSQNFTASERSASSSSHPISEPPFHLRRLRLHISETWIRVSSLSTRNQVWASLFLAVLFRSPLPPYLLFVYHIVSAVRTIAGKWVSVFTRDSRNREAFGYLQYFFRRVFEEGQKAVEGDYTRQVMAGYLHYACTAPGESYIAACIRYHMSVINQRFINEMEEWQLRRLGYEKSKRDLMQI